MQNARMRVTVISTFYFQLSAFLYFSLLNREGKKGSAGVPPALEIR
jgi:hypothetical protein